MTTAADQRVAAALDRALELGEVGVQVAAYRYGELIVDAGAGVADVETGRTVDTSTLFAVFSVTKAVTATAVHVQAERGLVDYRAPVARYWPEFAANGKASITVRDILSHRAGIPWMPEGVTPERQADWDWMVRRIEAMEPIFEPGTTSCYHALIWGWIVGELVRRTDPGRREIGSFLRAEVFDPLGIDDLFLGLPSSETSRVATLVGGGPPEDPPFPHLFDGMPRAVYPCANLYNDDLVRQSVNPAAGAIGTARSFARLFAMLANGGELDGVRLLSQERVASFTERRDDADALDRYVMAPMPVGAFGYCLGGVGPAANPVIGFGTRILQHPGAGGSIAWADLDTGLAVAICHNQMHGVIDPDAHPFMSIGEAVRAIAADPSRASAA